MQHTSIRRDTMGNEKFRRSPTGDQNTNLVDVGARKSGWRISLKKIQYHTHNQQQTSISSQLIVTQIHHPLFDQCTFFGLSKVESSGHTAYINGQMECNASKMQPQVHSFNIPMHTTPGASETRRDETPGVSEMRRLGRDKTRRDKMRRDAWGEQDQIGGKGDETNRRGRARRDETPQDETLGASKMK